MLYVGYYLRVTQKDPSCWYPARTHRQCFHRLHKSLLTIEKPYVCYSAENLDFNYMSWGKIWKKGRDLIPYHEIDIIAPRSYRIKKKFWSAVHPDAAGHRTIIFEDSIWEVKINILEIGWESSTVRYPLKRLQYGNQK